MSYTQQLIKFIKKLSNLFDVFKNNKIIVEELNIHIAFIFDTFHIQLNNEIYKEICKVTKNIINDYIWRFIDMGKILFQFLFYEKNKWEEATGEIIKENYIKYELLGEIIHNNDLTDEEKINRIKKLFNINISR